ncbi:hypothetical protein DL96DRAFT_1473726, partial [Flagelloscypha sp. PMI_526]
MPPSHPGHLRTAPTPSDALTALNDINRLLRGAKRAKGGSYIDPGFDDFVRLRLEAIRGFLNFYTDYRSVTFQQWGPSARMAALSVSRGEHCARTLCSMARAYIANRKVIPVNPYGEWSKSFLDDDALVSDIKIFLMSLGDKITAEKLCEFLCREDMMLRHHIEKKVSVRTCQRYLDGLSYRFELAKKGQFIDGHERPDVVFHRDRVFIPQMMELFGRMIIWNADGHENGPQLNGKPVMVHFHDETIFYAHDRRRKFWQLKNESATPQPKGDGPSWMIAQYVSQDIGFLVSKDGTATA